MITGSGRGKRSARREDRFRSIVRRRIGRLMDFANCRGVHGDEATRKRDASLKKDTESFFREWLDASQWRTP